MTPPPPPPRPPSHPIPTNPQAAAAALRQVPALTMQWDEAAGEAVPYPGGAASQGEAPVDVCVAVATPAGLITPIVFGADRLSLSGVSGEVRSLAGRARENKLKPEEFQGGCFTISNLGMFGVSSFSAVINPPQAAILAVGAGVSGVTAASADGTDRAAALQGVEPSTSITVRLSADRRVVSEAQAADFLRAFAEQMEAPERLAV